MKLLYFINHGQYKTEVEGTRINENLVYTKNDKLYVVTHLPTGMKVIEGTKLNKVKEEAVEILERNKEWASERMKKINLESLPTKEEFNEVISELLDVLDLSRLPYEPIAYAISSKLIIDYVELERQIKRKDVSYDDTKSLKDNVINLYGENTVKLLEKFAV